MSKTTKKQLEAEVAALRARVAEQSAVIAKLVAYTAPLWPAYPPPVYVPVPCGRPHADEGWRLVPYVPYVPQPYAPNYPTWPWPDNGVTYVDDVTWVGNAVPNNAGCAAPMLGGQSLTLDWTAPPAALGAGSFVCSTSSSSFH